MAYDASIYNPLSAYSWQQPVQGITYIDSVKEADSYGMPPNSVSQPLMLRSDDVFIIKTTDQSGGWTLEAYRFEKIPIEELSAPVPGYVTKADFDAFAKKVMEAIDGKLAVEEQPAEE